MAALIYLHEEIRRAEASKAHHQQQKKADFISKVRKQIVRIKDPEKRKEKLESVKIMMEERQENLLEIAGMDQAARKSLGAKLFLDYCCTAEDCRAASQALEAVESNKVRPVTRVAEPGRSSAEVSDMQEVHAAPMARRSRPKAM